MWHRCVIDVTIFCGKILADRVSATWAINLSISAPASIRLVRSTVHHAITTSPRGSRCRDLDTYRAMPE
jgi:hypothetical protein